MTTALKEMFDAVDKLRNRENKNAIADKRLKWRENLLTLDEIQTVQDNWEWVV